MSRRVLFTLGLYLILSFVRLEAETSKLSFDKYHSPAEVSSLLNSWALQYPRLAQLIPIGKSAGNTELLVLRLAAQEKAGPDPDMRPAIFISANLEGVHVVGTEAALMLADKLLSRSSTDAKISALLSKRTIYLAPLLNPDGAQNFFASVRYEKWSNSRPEDEDDDGLLDEDGPEDLNKDGLITQMRVKDPEGKWIPDPKESRLVRLADPTKGEKGIYTLYTEGIDNDGDGEYNEDYPGGVALNRNFPHDFEYDAKPASRYPISEAETIAVLKFLSSHRNIALALNFSTENTFLNLQQTGQARAGGDRVKVPKMIAGFLGLEPDAEYSIKEIVEILKGMNIGGGQEITEDMVATFFGMGPAVALDREDVPIFEAIQKEYKDALKEAKLDYPEKRAKGVGKGSFAAYAYFQYGVPVFSSDLWAVPEPKKEPPKDALTADKLKTMSSEEFIALGEEKVAAFLKDQGAPPNINAGMLIGMVKSGQVNPAKMAEMIEKMPKKPQAEGEEHPDAYLLSWSDTFLKGKGFVSWTPYKHPALGDVEIGGFVPYLRINPPPAEIEKTISFQTDFYLKLMDKVAELAVKESKVQALGPDVYQVTVYYTNNGWFPTATAQGRRAQTSWPIRVRVKTGADQVIFSGKPIESIPSIGGSGDTRKLEWTIKGKKGSKVTISAWSPKLGTLDTTLVLE